MKTKQKPMTLVQAHKLRDAVLIPLGKISEYTDRWADLELLLMELVEGVEVMSCCDISEAEASRLIELEDILLPQIDWQYQAILRRFDEAIYDETDDDYDDDLERA